MLSCCVQITHLVLSSSVLCSRSFAQPIPGSKQTSHVHLHPTTSKNTVEVSTSSARTSESAQRTRERRNDNPCITSSISHPHNPTNPLHKATNLSSTSLTFDTTRRCTITKPTHASIHKPSETQPSLQFFLLQASPSHVCCWIPQ